MDYLKKSKYFYILVLLFSSLLVWSEIKNSDFLSRIVGVTFSTLLIPVIISIFLYYMLRPLYLFLLKVGKNEPISLIGTFAVLSLLIYFLIREVIPVLFVQIDTILTEFPRWIEEFDKWLIQSQLLGEGNVQYYLSLINTSIEDLIDLIFLGLQNGIQIIMAIIASSFLVVSLVPIMVLFMLKKTNKPKEVPAWIPKSYRSVSKQFFYDLEKTLSDYIGGKSLVCLYVFLGAWATFYFAGLKGALVFAVIAGLMDIVPYFGPWIGTLPAILSALVSNEVNIFIIIIGILIVQLGESYLVSPYIMSKELKMHPLAVIIILLITGQVFGFLGMIIILPLVAALKVIIDYGIKVYRIRKAESKTVLKDSAHEE